MDFFVNPGLLLTPKPRMLFDQSASVILQRTKLPFGGFQSMGVLPVIIHLNGIFHEINHPAIRVPPFMETPIDIHLARGKPPWSPPFTRCLPAGKS